MQQSVVPPMLAMQRLDAAIETGTLGQRGIDEGAAVIKLDGVGRDHRLLERDRVAPRLQGDELVTQALMQMHRGGLDIVEARNEPQPGTIGPGFVILCADQHHIGLIWRLIRLSLEQ